jgi:hypothetical protein
MPFLGADSLLCEEPAGGDNHFGFCAIPGSNQYYVWAECTATCPDGPYPGVELRVVTDSTELRDYILIINDLDQAIESKKEGSRQGWVLGLFDFVGGVLGFGAACGLGSEFTFGWSCVGWFLTAGGGGIGSYLGFDKYADNNIQQETLGRSASDKFREIP